MSIWFYMFIILLIICIVLILKLLIMKSSLRNIIKKINKIVESDTNNLITVSTNDKDIITFANEINKSLEKLRNIELEYKQGNIDLKHSITNISHDLRTPLTAIRGYLDIMEKENLTLKQQEYIDIVDTKVDELIYLTEELFIYSTNTVDFKKLNKIDICLNSELENIICSFYTLFKQNDIEPNIDICNSKVIRKIDLNCFKRIIENIISNAIKYSDGDLKISLSKSGEITFTNNTTKLDKTSVEKLFNRYYTVEDGKKGTGLGLSIAKSLTELNGGTIETMYLKNNFKIIIRFN